MPVVNAVEVRICKLEALQSSHISLRFSRLLSIMPFCFIFY
jgi:hypothetical protein